MTLPSGQRAADNIRWGTAALIHHRSASTSSRRSASAASAPQTSILCPPCLLCDRSRGVSRRQEWSSAPSQVLLRSTATSSAGYHELLYVYSRPPQCMRWACALCPWTHCRTGDCSGSVEWRTACQGAPDVPAQLSRDVRSRCSCREPSVSSVTTGSVITLNHCDWCDAHA